MNKFKAFLSVSRANLLLASIGHATLGILLAAPALGDVISLKALLFIILHYAIALMACNVNSLSDVDVDRRYKRYISDGVDAIGHRAVLAIVGAFFLISATITSYFFLSGYRVTAYLAILGMLCAFAYSVRPIRLKGRGILGPIPILFGLYMLPLLGGWFLFRTEMDMLFLVFVAGYALMNEGYTLVNTCEDYSEDRAEGLRTWAHVLGLRRTLKLAYAMAFLGLLCPVSMLLLAYGGKATLTGSAPVLLAIATATFLILKAAAEVGEAGRFRDPEAGAKAYGPRLQRWFLMTRYPLIITAIAMLLRFT